MAKRLVYPYGIASISGLLKSQASDFKVTEELGFEPAGEGEHLFLLIEKSMMTTHELIERVAGDFFIKPRDIGYSGLKDKLAVTQQWLSLYLPGQMNSLGLPGVSDYCLLDHAWHNKKLRSGTHRSNHFEVIVRNIESLPEATQQQIDMIRNQGMANYFGEQRFGRQGDNVEQALRVFSSTRRSRKLSRSKKSLYLSALRSFLFNRVLSERIEQGIWDAPITGDVFMLRGSRSIFYESINEELIERFKRQDIASTISLYGVGNRLLQARAQEIEDAVLAEFETIRHCLLQQKASLQMRSTRVAVTDLKVEFDEDEATLRIEARLPRGSYFTTLLDHFINTGRSQ
ncbi:MAG: tRNA pseudouridine(13) synthase TruD [Gammaproteobacteria bacterium]|nr:tRNA pseudouridine(13) synthase TruD [Gammaproteobacteria bacterium]